MIKYIFFGVYQTSIKSNNKLIAVEEHIYCISPKIQNFKSKIQISTKQYVASLHKDVQQICNLQSPTLAGGSFALKLVSPPLVSSSM